MKVLNINSVSVLKIYLENNYIVEIIHEENYINFWLYKKEYCVKDYMFGIEDKNQKFSDLLKIISNNIEIYIKLYKNRYEDEEETYE